jgi:hypothetical protein
MSMPRCVAFSSDPPEMRSETKSLEQIRDLQSLERNNKIKGAGKKRF